VLERLKNGEVELALASVLAEQWERLDRWPLFNESFHLVVERRHSLVSRPAVDIGDLQEEPILQCRFSEHAERTATLLRANNLDVDHGHEIEVASDLIPLLEAGLGVAILPGSTSIPATLIRRAVNGIDLRRTLYVYGVAGRQRSAVASAMLKMLRAADWSPYED
jgi:DNA-binding transcriptional LysR family regulator